MADWYGEEDKRLMKTDPVTAASLDERLGEPDRRWYGLFAEWCEYHRVTNILTDAERMLAEVRDHAAAGHVPDQVELLTRLFTAIPPQWNADTLPVSVAKEIGKELTDAVLAVDQVLPLDLGGRPPTPELGVELKEYGTFGALVWLALTEPDVVLRWVVALAATSDGYVRSIRASFVDECTALAATVEDAAVPVPVPVPGPGHGHGHVTVRLMAAGRQWAVEGGWNETIRALAESGFPEPTEEERTRLVAEAHAGGAARTWLLAKPRVHLTAIAEAGGRTRFDLDAAVGKQDAIAVNREAVAGFDVPGGEGFYVQFGGVVLLSASPQGLMPIWCLLQSASVLADGVPPELSLGRISVRRYGKSDDRRRWVLTPMLDGYRDPAVTAIQAVSPNAVVEFG